MTILSGKKVQTKFLHSGGNYRDEVNSSSKFFIHFDIRKEDKYAANYAFDSMFAYRSSIEFDNKSFVKTSYGQNGLALTLPDEDIVIPARDRNVREQEFNEYYEDYFPNPLNHYFLLNRGEGFKKFVTPWLFIPRSDVDSFSCYLTGYIWHIPNSESKADSLKSLPNDDLEIEILGFSEQEEKWLESKSSGHLKAFWTNFSKENLGTKISKNKLLSNAETTSGDTTLFERNSEFRDIPKSEIKSGADTFSAEYIPVINDLTSDDFDTIFLPYKGKESELLGKYIPGYVEERVDVIQHKDALLTEDSDPWFFRNHSMPTLLGIEYPKTDSTVVVPPTTELVRVKSAGKIVSQLAVTFGELLNQKLIHLHGSLDQNTLKLHQTNSYTTNIEPRNGYIQSVKDNMLLVSKAYKAIGVLIEESNFSIMRKEYDETSPIILDWDIIMSNSNPTTTDILNKLTEWLINQERMIEFGSEKISSLQCVYVIELDFVPVDQGVNDRGIARRGGNIALTWVNQNWEEKFVKASTLVHEIAHTLGATHTFESSQKSHSAHLAYAARTFSSVDMDIFFDTVRKHSVHDAFIKTESLSRLNSTEAEKIRKEKFYQSVSSLHYAYRIEKGRTNYWLDYNIFKKKLSYIEPFTVGVPFTVTLVSMPVKTLRTDFACYHWDIIRHRIQVLNSIGK